MKTIGSFLNRSLLDLPTIAEQIAKTLKTCDYFAVSLEGTMGAGKTTLVGCILHAFGLPENITVTSPTYTYLNEYEINGAWYAHLDFYRANDKLSIADLGLLDTRDFKGIFVEWPSSLSTKEFLEFTHNIAISFTDGGQKRSYELTQKS
jgi:tRNA threonylcarbamoyl adenosine modification protein YjeE